ncbi:broad-complex core protein isoforms 1/2/3/4/5 isoform X1 [Drosophila eugracilis]|uniref:broad-complex core protein isoforms 1/2/3/4/5 isoform X1 n=1 Tax=Drosophila eugracilis TaxID=29029 RepID=UPI0007E78F20|nr:broad-complex core protein isoforms 1/2/3/4/5 isoform X1 [Drosophila eugracilis]XP_017062904.1 broad-complex core protein isoforms 1/2/3/4/5 isoform X1 [Drosophila eugracilis]XP_017062905.1 broad-complex core protein isoforms 1/2/3/4/5 isoform X1 [Drosophila eugracilis]
MDDTQHFCLRWNNYQSSITSAFENLRDDEAFVDVTLACEGRSIKAHRVVLSACSPYFRELLKSTPCKHPVILLQDVSFMDLHSLVEFIYHGEVNVHQKSLQSFLKTAEVLRVSGLTQQQAEDTHSHLAQIQNLANSGGRTPLNSHAHSHPHPHHGSLHDDGGSSTLFSRQGAGSPPPPAVPSLPPHINNQLLKRMAMMHRNSAAAAAAEETSHALKRLRGSDNGLALSGAVGSGSNNNSPDLPPLHARSTSPQQTPADFSTIKHHNNNNTPPLKEEKRNGPTGNGNSGNGNGNGASNGNGISISDKLGSLTPSPLARAGADDVKSEPMELVCSNNNANANDEHSNDSTGEHDANRSSSGDGGKGSLSSGNDEEIGDGLASHHAAPQFIMSPAENKMFHAAAFNFPISNLDHSALLGLNTQLQQSGDLAVSPQGPHSITRSAATSPTSSTSSPPSPPTALTSPTSSLNGSLAAAVYNLHSHAHGHVLGHATSPPRPGSVGSSMGSNLCSSTTMGNTGTNSSNNNNNNNNGNNTNSNSNNGNGNTNSNNNNGSSPGSQSASAGGGVAQAGAPQLPLRMPPPTSGGINEPQECPYCRRTFSCYYSLKRHFQDKHEQSDTLYVCEFCHRRYRTKNSLTTHKSLQHRGSSGMLKRLLKTSAIKHGLVGHGHGHGHLPHPHHHALSHPRTSLFDFTSELGQPPPGIQ